MKFQQYFNKIRQDKVIINVLDQNYKFQLVTKFNFNFLMLNNFLDFKLYILLVDFFWLNCYKFRLVIFMGK